jgi:hypothetical protein
MTGIGIGIGIGVPRDGVRLAGGGGLSSFSDDFERADGSLGNGWPTVSTWSIVSGSAVNTPTLGSELLTDPGLEATYTAGKCATLVIDTGTYTLAQSADVHGGSKAQEITASSQSGSLRFNPRPTIVPGTWYEASIWAKRTVGTQSQLSFYLSASGMKPAADLFRFLVDAIYTQKRIAFRAGAGTSLSAFFRNHTTTYDTVIADDGSVKALTFAEILELRQGAAAWNVRAAVTLVDGLVGLASHVDSVVNPQNGIFAYMYWTSQYFYIICEKLVNGTWTQMFVPTIKTYTADKILEIRYLSANTFGVFYDNVQVSTDMTIADASIVSNDLYGMMATGGATVQSFFTGAP